MQRGKFISIEGVEGAGKSTVIKCIKDYLTKANIEAVWTREPGGTPLAEKIRELVLSPKLDESMTAEMELLLMFAARAQHVQKLILPSLHAGQWVASDRFIDASYAYQGGGRHMPLEQITTLDKWTVGAMYPDLTILLDLPPELGFERADKRGTERDRIEQEKIEFFTRVRAAYLERAKQDPARIKIVDASMPLFAVENHVCAILDKFIKRSL